MIIQGNVSLTTGSAVDILAALGVTDVDRYIEVHIMLGSGNVYLGGQTVSSDGLPVTTSAQVFRVREGGLWAFAASSGGSGQFLRVLASLL